MKTKVIEKPIIIFGTGRSGTTVFHRMLSTHPRIAWLSGVCDKYPDKPTLNRVLMRALEFPLLNKILRKRISPSECYTFWEHYCKGFSTPCRDLLTSDVIEKNKNQIQHVMSEMITERKNRLLIKITGWPRLGFLSEVFEDAKFIHVLRDGRAVANSLIHVGFWMGWRGPENWRWGPLSPTHEEEWNRYNRSFIVLAAIQWKILMDAVETAKEYVNDNNLLEIKYERLCSNQIEVFENIAEFSELEWTKGFERELRSFKLKNTNDKWERELNPNQRRELNEVLADYLKRHDYS